MTQSWQQNPPATPPPPPASWSRRPRRSIVDRKIAGVAGGLGRSLGIDPILLRVAFVVLAIFGGFGFLLYSLGWLLLPDDRDEVSAGEALLGRGSSSVPPVLAVGLGIAAMISLFSMLSWGLPFWPLVIGGIVLVLVMKKRSPGWAQHTERDARRWEEHAERQARRWADRGSAAGRGPWGPGWNWGFGCGHGGSQSQQSAHGAQSQSPGSSPFSGPAFWDAPDPESRRKEADAPGQSPGAADPVSLHKNAGATAAHNTGPTADADDPFLDRRTPPAWDPLGVAPFAWDLPEPAPAPAPPAPRNRQVVNRVTGGIALLAASFATLGLFLGWWALTWAQVSGIVLAILATGLLLSSLRGRGAALAIPAIPVALATVVLSITGISGTDGFGRSNWSPGTPAEASAQTYVVNAGHGELDLTNLAIPAGQTVPVRLELRAGYAEVILPDNVAVDATCEVSAGATSCLGTEVRGTNRSTSQSLAGTADEGKIELTVSVGGGYAAVNRESVFEQRDGG